MTRTCALPDGGPLTGQAFINGYKVGSTCAAAFSAITPVGDLYVNVAAYAGYLRAENLGPRTKTTCTESVNQFPASVQS